MALIRRAAVLVLVLGSVASAQPGPDAGVPDAPPTDAGPPAQFEPPHAIGSTEIPAPANAPVITAPVVVTVKLRVGKDGTVSKVDLVTPPQPPFDDAVIAAAQQFKFQPGTYGGNPVAVEITFTHTFVPPPPPPPVTPVEQGPPRTSVLRGRLIELGTRLPVASATVNVEIAGQRYTTDADAKGHFRVQVPPGHAKVSVYAPSHNPFVQQETIPPRTELAVAYLVERDRYDPYEIVVVGEQRREEVSRITLKGPEIQQVPGTFGDPFRVIQALPGVASVVSLLPFPVVRGSSPSSTGFEIDGIRVPLLFHLLAGPSVIHPEFIDEIQFYPGGAPAPYGGYTGGIIDGITARAAPDAHLIDVDLNLLQVGGLVREPVPELDATVTAAARYGFPGLLLSLATDQASLAYWDYQLRLDGGTKNDGWTMFLFGAHDELDLVAANAPTNESNPPLSPALELTFHRLDLRYHRTFGELDTTARVTGGFDKTFSMGTDFWVWSLDPSLRARYKASKQLDLQAGIDGEFRDLQQGGGTNASAGGLSSLTAGLSTSYWGSVFAEALWRPTSDWLIRPGVRADAYTDSTATKSDVDPRLTVRYKLGHRDLPDVAPDSDDSAVWLKGSAGIYHQPPRFVVPLPGLDQMPLKYGLLESYQTSLGTEIPLEHRFDLSTEAFFNYMDPTIFDLSTSALTAGTAANNSLLPTQIITGTDMGQDIINRLTTPEKGAAYGLEVMLRRKAKSGIFGWVSYTLSRSERDMQEVGALPARYKWVPYDYDRTQLFSLVAGLPLRRNWDVGVRVQYQSGLPATTTSGYNTAREDGFWEFDVRVDKRAVYKKWLLDFYVDITNVALLPEEVTPGNTIRYVLPTAGFRGRF
ncbi:MAG TPA: TonB-dependent receptor [Kofleriaceae bacterium]